MSSLPTSFSAATPPVGAVPPSSARAKSSLPTALAALVLVGTLVTTLGLWRSAQADVEHELQAYFDFRVRDAEARVTQRMLASEQVLLGGAGLFAATARVERHEFRAYAASLRLQDNCPGLQGVGFSVIVPASSRDGHTAAIRREGFPEYLIHPEGRREPYTSIIYLEPFTGRNLRAFGYDMFSDPVRRAAMELARDSGRPSLSGKVTLAQDTEREIQAGVLMYLPVYRQGALSGTVAERRANIVGWVYLPFHMNDLMSGTFGERASDLDVEIFDGAEPSVGTMMYDRDGIPSATDHRRARFQTERPLEIAGHRWTMGVRSLPGFEGRLNSEKPRHLAQAGAAASVLLALVVWLLAQGRERALREARDLNREVTERKSVESALRGANVELKQLVEQVEQMAMTDILTGLPNRRYAMDRLAQTWALSVRHGHPLACLLIDADGFKQVNDTHGHEAGDGVLKALGAALRNAVRACDEVCRLGGDEFLVIAPETPLAGALWLGERVRASVAQLRVPAGAGAWHGSVSVGVAARRPGLADLESLLRAADSGVYAAKGAGRNAVRAGDEEECCSAMASAEPLTSTGT